jgi:hypothetical protein
MRAKSIVKKKLVMDNSVKMTVFGYDARIDTLYVIAVPHPKDLTKIADDLSSIPGCFGLSAGIPIPLKEKGHLLYTPEEVKVKKVLES